jgi:hypothetical protein
MTPVSNMNEVLSMESEENLRDRLFMESLASEINDLIKNDFEKLVNLLYRIDVSESKLKSMLQSNPDTDAGHIIAGLLIERQLQKIKLKKEFTSKYPEPDEEEKW